MSFILDALRKSEHERQRQSGPDIAPLHSTPRRSGIPIWGIAVGALLGINVIVVLVLVLRHGQQQTTLAPADAATPIASSVAAIPESHAATVPAPSPAVPAPTATNIQQSAPLPPPAASNLPQPAPLSATPSPLPAPSPADPMLRDEQADERLPTIHELNFQGANALPQLHLDIHVYASKPKDRFVFVNMNKYKEGEQTAEGILVERITPDGVILNRNGTRFILPRQ